MCFFGIMYLREGALCYNGEFMDILLEYLPAIIKFLPTTLFLLIILTNVLKGSRRGKRKSIIYFINMLIATVVSIIFFIVMDYNTLIPFIDMIMPDLGLGGKTMETICAEYSQAMGLTGDGMAEVMLVYIELAFDFLVFCLLMGFIYGFTTFILSVVYFFAFRKKVKLHVEEHGKKKIGGMVIGGIRGFVTAFLIFSQLSTVYCIVAGDVFYSKDDYQTIMVNGEAWEYDEIYKAIKTSRSFGLGYLFDNIAGETGTPIDYFYVDFFLRADYESGDTTLILREEIANTMGVAAHLFDSGVLEYVPNTDQMFTVNQDKLTDEVIQGVCNSLSGIGTITDVLPVVTLDLISEKTGLVIEDKYLKSLDLENDINVVADVLCGFFSMVGLEDTLAGDIDYMGLEDEIVDSILTSISHLTFLTKVALPLGVEFAAEKITSIVFDLNSILWDEEIQNLQGLYKMIQNLGISAGALADSDTYTQLLQDSEKVSIINSVIKQVFDSELFCEIAKVAIKYTFDKFLVDLNYFENVEIDLDSYDKDTIYHDICIIADSLVDGIDLVSVITGGTDSYFSLDVTPIKEVFVGTFEKYGLLDMNLITFMDIATVISNLCVMYLNTEIPHIDDLKVEFTHMFDSLELIQDSGMKREEIMNGDYSSITSLEKEKSDKITDSISSSIIMSYALGANINTYAGDMLVIPDNVEWYGVDGEVNYLLDSIFHLLRIDGMSGLMDGDYSALSNLESSDIEFILNSCVLHATLSGYIEKMPESYDTIVIDIAAYDSNGYISKEEIVKLADFAISNDLTDTSNISVDSLLLFSDENVASINESIILSRTIVNYLKNNEIITIPKDITDNDWYSDLKGEEELLSLLEALQELFGKDATINDIGELDVNEAIKKGGTILQSKILVITVSEKVIELESLKIPESVYTDYYGEENVIAQEHLIGLFDALGADGLAVKDFNNFDINSVFAELNLLEKALKLSLIIHYTVSDGVLSGKSNTDLVIIKEAVEENFIFEYNDSLSNKVEFESKVDVLTVDEILNLLNAMNIVSGDADAQLGSVGVTLADLQKADPTTLETITNSIIMRTLITELLTDDGGTPGKSILDVYNAAILNPDDQIEPDLESVYKKDGIEVEVLTYEDIVLLIAFNKTLSKT